MTKGTITGLETRTVFPGSNAFAAQLVIAATGDVAPSAAGSAGIIVRAQVAGARIDTAGNVHGGDGATPGGAGGVGIEARAATAVTNAGTITGGTAYNDASQAAAQTAYNGGAGVVLLRGGSIANAGLISGGTGSYGGGNGGVGVFISGATLQNAGAILGGTAGSIVSLVPPVSHADSVARQSVRTGEPQSRGGAGANLVSGSIGFNSGSITGGDGNYQNGDGGAGVLLTGSALTNTGTIAGGKGGYGYDYAPPNGAGGVGVSLTRGSILNDAGQIWGGDATVTHEVAGPGGVGVAVDRSQLFVSGTVRGGTGGTGNFSYDGNGGAGVTLHGGLVSLTGTIAGGAAGAGGSYGRGLGGVGVVMDGGTLIDGGTINGGLMYEATDHRALAISFGSEASVLVLKPQAVLRGDVAATAGANDTLVLSTGGAGTLAGLGSGMTGFDHITVAADARWTVTDRAILTSQETLRDNGSLTLDAALSGAGAITLEAKSTLTAAAGVSGVGVAFDGAATLVLDSVSTVSSTLSGFSTGDTIDLAKLSVTADYLNGTLTLKDSSTTVGTLAFAGNFTQHNFSVGSDGQGGTDISYLAPAKDIAFSDLQDTPAAVLGTLEPEHGLWQSFMHEILK